MLTRKIDNLIEDKPIPDQAFVCISFLSPEGIRNCKIRGLKIRGVFPTKEKADEHAKNLQKEDPDFHVFVGEVGKWLPWDPEPGDVSEQHYNEEELQKLMDAYKKNRKQINDIEKERKHDLLQNARVDNRKQAIVERLRKKLNKMKESVAEKSESANVGRSTLVQNAAPAVAAPAVAMPDDDDADDVDDPVVSLEKQVAEKENQIKENEQVLQEVNSLEADFESIAKLHKQLHNK